MSEIRIFKRDKVTLLTSTYQEVLELYAPAVGVGKLDHWDNLVLAMSSNFASSTPEYYAQLVIETEDGSLTPVHQAKWTSGFGSSAGAKTVRTTSAADGPIRNFLLLDTVNKTVALDRVAGLWVGIVNELLTAIDENAFPFDSTIPSLPERPALSMPLTLGVQERLILRMRAVNTSSTIVHGIARGAAVESR